MKAEQLHLGVCSQADHEATKATLVTFLQAHVFQGIQGTGEETLVLANCLRCKSTLGYEPRGRFELSYTENLR